MPDDPAKRPAPARPRRLAHYELHAVAGRGAASTVYRATDLRTGQAVALKILPRSADPSLRQSLATEMRAAQALEHPNIVRVLESGEAAGRMLDQHQGAGLGAFAGLLENVDTKLVRATITTGPLGLANEALASSLRKLTGVELPSYLSALDSLAVKAEDVMKRLGLGGGAPSSGPLNPNSFAGAFDGFGLDHAKKLFSGGGSKAKAEKQGFITIDFGEELDELEGQRDELKRHGAILLEQQKQGDTLSALNKGILEGTQSLVDLAGQAAALRAAGGAAALSSVAGIKDSEGLLRALPFGDILADIGSIVTNMPALVNDIRRDLVQGPLKIGQAFEKTMTTAIPKLIQAFPTIIENLIFKLPMAIARGIVEGIPKILLAIAKAIGEAIKNALNFLKGGDDKNVLTGEKGKFLGTSFKKGRFSILGMFNNDDADPGELGQAKGKSHHAGTRFIPRTGLYHLQKDEEVRPAHAKSGGMGGQNIVINIGSLFPRNLDEFIREIQARVGTYGTGGSLSRS
jgi:hypothetical protein